MKKVSTVLLLLIISLAVSSNLQAQSIFDKVKKAVEQQKNADSSTTNKSTSSNNSAVEKLSSTDVSGALKQALNIGVEEGIKKLGAEDGFYKNNLVKILLPEKLQKVESTLRMMGMGSLADQGIKLLNRAAEDAVTEGVPIFANAITSMTFDDAKKILLGTDTAATSYLKGKTSAQLYQAFEPKVENSLGKVGADKVWNQIITKYNSITKQNVTPDLNQYVTEETLNGVFKMVAEKEKGVRDNAAFRSTSLLKKVFGALD
ncbi:MULTISPECIES: DUF4197 domain-containing protein [Olivibacter]|uniref:DUF4197 domain-containing protein n=1 Tax=Olivibacter jilunii TaxID=985016 RepID=A0ABW6B0L7_9SPHI|nr:DUF4197 domain-containing protein [Olivibacter sp. UJ_SKK_5.1]MDX3917178.1 DUF4197 domain-containing protein [Pseudosphingobacterium sp.]